MTGRRLHIERTARGIVLRYAIADVPAVIHLGAREAERGGASLTLPDEEIVAIDDRYRVERRAPLAVES
ncbi:hypothetical protein C5C31_01380 [Rathayibacter rathayi]|uniref:hypothetical protein n=1 Tax=Rathayibacter rathayi TaxID=33887 RepID=UPI000CE8FAA9|nr:hypothetical protein [Rathayibacter rathayi]PPG71943.1 hypothetical protein C5C02_00985 [Rathayibacter rathayi]PPG78997.1 hypothetical protein C5C23_00835 [Rathayibacter rathayi]PPH26479.1 hypothetical protein C5C31_01380 [Rathayibacter rathayi]PPI76654.1 hypothetical protein C5E03_08080 [Rathayibacter rathayi]